MAKSKPVTSTKSAAVIFDSGDEDEEPVELPKTIAEKAKSTDNKDPKPAKERKAKKSQEPKAAKSKATPKSKPAKKEAATKAKGNATVPKVNGTSNPQLENEGSTESEVDSVADENAGRDEESTGPVTNDASRSETGVKVKDSGIAKQTTFEEDNADLVDELSSGSGSESSSGSEEDDEEEQATTAQTSGGTAENTTSQPAPSQEFKPPTGFSKAKLSSSPQLSSMFSEGNLKGKQIWHITVPTSVPVSKLKELATKKFEQGETALSHKGVDYGFVESTETHNSERFLLPTKLDKTSDQYSSSSKRIARVLNIQQVVAPFNTSGEGSIQTTAPTPPYTKAKPVQPKGLKTRHRPFGVEATDEEEEESQPAQFRMPVDAPRKEKRKASGEPAIDDVGQDPSSKAKKRKKDKAQSLSSQSLNGSSQVSQGANGVNGSSLSKEHKHKSESADDKAARRAAKKAAKTAKA